MEHHQKHHKENLALIGDNGLKILSKKQKARNKFPPKLKA
jgi:hypothetical protein